MGPWCTSEVYQYTIRPKWFGYGNKNNKGIQAHWNVSLSILVEFSSLMTKRSVALMHTGIVCHKWLYYFTTLQLIMLYIDKLMEREI